MESATNLANLINFNIIAKGTSAREVSRFVTGYLDRLPALLMKDEIKKYNTYLSDMVDDSTIKKRQNNVNLKEIYTDFGRPNYINLHIAEEYVEKARAWNKDVENYNHRLTELRQNLGIDNNTKLKVDSKEAAETHYVNGKHYLTSLNEKGRIDFENAEKQFEIARNKGKISEFKYLELDALEALFRLKYLQSYIDTEEREQRFVYQKDFERLNRELRESNILYHDILAKYYNTVGDIAFDNRNIILDRDDLIEQKKYLQAAFEAYCKMIEHALKHNEHRYNTTLGVLLNRFEKLKSHHNAHIYIPFCWEIVEKNLDSLKKEDESLSSFLRAAKLAISFTGDEDSEGEEIKAAIRKFVTATHFSKAIQLNQILIQFYKDYQYKNYQKELKQQVLS